MWKMENLTGKQLAKPYSISTNWQVSHGSEIENCITVEHIKENSLAKT